MKQIKSSKKFKKYALSKSYSTWRNIGICLIVLLILARIFVIFDTIVYNTNTAATNLKLQIEQDVNQIRYQFNYYTSLLYSGRALFTVNNSVTRQDWFTFYNNQIFANRFPGFYAVAYISVINHSQIGPFTSILNQNRLPSETNQITIFPDTNGNQLAVLTYIAPSSANQNTIGYNLFSSQTRKSILLSAANSGLEAVSNPLSLKGLVESKNPNGVLIVLPVYNNSTTMPLTSVSTRNASFNGYIVLATQLRHLLNPIFDSTPNNSFSITITNNNTTIYTNKRNISGESISENVSLKLANQIWNLKVSAPSNYSLSTTSTLAPSTILYTLAPLIVLLLLTLYFALKYHQSQHHD